MNKIKVMSIFGTRPEAIKMAPLVKELEKRAETESIVCVTAQHREMLDQVLETFKIKPDYDLNMMKQGQTLMDITIGALSGVDAVIKKAKPDIVLVHGDTSTTFAGGLAAFYNQVAIGHVEAGLRTYNKYSPYPEEMNRQMVDCMTDMYFAPTDLSRDNLIKEHVDPSKIYVTGNTAIDAMDTTVDEGYTHPELEWLGGDKMILLTAHRRENLGEPMKNIFRGIRRVLDELPGYKKQLEAIQETKKPKQRMAFSCELNDQCMKLLSTGKCDIQALKTQVQQNNTQQLHRITTSLWIARAYLAEQNRREAENILQQIVKLAPDLYPGREAARLLAELPAKAEG